MAQSFYPLNERMDNKQPTLTRGDLISIRHVVSSQDAYATIVQQATADMLSFRLPQDLMRFELLAAGDRVQIMHFDAESELYLEGCIASVDLQYPWLVSANIDALRRIPNRRTEKRCIVNLPAQIQILGHSNNRIDAAIRNINRKGVALATRSVLDPESIKEAMVFFSTPEGVRIEFKGKLIRHDAMERFHLHGMEIAHIDETGADAIERLVHRLTEDESSFIAENMK